MKTNITLKSIITKMFLSLLFAFALMSICPSTVHAATTANKAAVKQIIIDMLENCDTTTHNIYSYRITSSELEQIYNEIIDSDYNLLIESYEYNLYLSKSTKGLYVNNITFYGMNSDVFTLYPKLVETYNRILSGVDDSMSDLDKLLYFHDAIVDHVVYRNDGTNHIYGSNGALANGVAVCMGYADSLMLLLKSQGIESSYVRQKVTLNHGWVYVKLDGEWYHVDPTWDDTRSPIRGTTSRQFLLCNDDEFAAEGKNTHGDYNWSVVKTTEKSTSTRFSDWFVHDITGKMLYYQGYWYYVDTQTNNIISAKSDGSYSQIVVNGSGLDTITIVSVSNDTITYTWGGKTFSISTDSSQWSAESNFRDYYSIIDNVDWNNINSWQSGVYNYLTGYYEANSHRICLNSYYKAVPNSEYTYESSDDDYNMLIREMDENMKMISSYNLVSGQSFTTTAQTDSLAISLYIPTQDSIATYTTFKTAFDNKSLVINLVTPTNDNQDSISSSTSESDEIESEPIVESSTPNTINTFWNDITYWRSGQYSWINGTYLEYPSRICLNEYIECSPESKYTAIISDNLYKILIRQLDKDCNFIVSNIVASDDEFTTANNCMYLAISVYSPSLDSKLKYTDYEQLFENGITIGISHASAEGADTTGAETVQPPTVSEEQNPESSIPSSEEQAQESDNPSAENEKEHSSEEPIEENTDIEEIWEDSTAAETPEEASNDLKEETTSRLIWNDFSTWKSGQYHWITGKYIEYPSRICLTDYVTCNSNEEFVVIVNNPDLHLLVRQLDSSYNFISSHNLANGESFTTTQDCAFLAISLYSPNSDSSMTYSQFESLFANGIDVGIERVTTIDASDTPLSSAIGANHWVYVMIGFDALFIAILTILFIQKRTKQ